MVLSEAGSGTMATPLTHWARPWWQVAGEVVLALINLGQGNASVALGGGATGAVSWTAWILTAGARVDGAPSPLQSRETLLNGVKLELTAQGTLPPTPGAQGTGVVLLPPTSYGFVAVHGVHAPACAQPRSP
jgi:hypothetical protein